MPEEKWFDEYANQSADELIGLKPEYRIDSLLCAFEQAVQSKAVNQGEGSLTEAEKVILAVQEFSREVDSAGFSLYFCNSANGYADFIVRALELIGCPKTAETVQSAIEMVGLPKGSSETDYQSRIDEGEGISGKLEPLDDKFYANEEDLEAKLFEYIEINRRLINIVRKGFGDSGGIRNL